MSKSVREKKNRTFLFICIFYIFWEWCNIIVYIICIFDSANVKIIFGATLLGLASWSIVKRYQDLSWAHTRLHYKVVATTVVTPTEARSGAKGGKERRGKGERPGCMYTPGIVRFLRGTHGRTHTRGTSSSNLRPRKRLFTPFLSRRWGASFGPDFARGASGKRPLCNLISLPSPALHFDRSIQIRRHFPSLLPFKRVIFAFPASLKTRFFREYRNISCIECRVFFSTDFFIHAPGVEPINDDRCKNRYKNQPFRWSKEPYGMCIVDQIIVWQVRREDSSNFRTSMTGLSTSCRCSNLEDIWERSRQRGR